MPDTIVEIDCSTGEQTERELTPEEQAQRDQESAAAAEAALAAAWDDLYETRNLKLTGSDWIANHPSDLPAEIQGQITQYETEWAAYRQSLRDLPESTANPAQPVWPIPPPLPLLPFTAPGEPSYYRRKPHPS